MGARKLVSLQRPKRHWNLTDNSNAYVMLRSSKTGSGHSENCVYHTCTDLCSSCPQNGRKFGVKERNGVMPAWGMS